MQWFAKVHNGAPQLSYDLIKPPPPPPPFSNFSVWLWHTISGFPWTYSIYNLISIITPLFTPHDTPTENHWSVIAVGTKKSLKYDTVRYDTWVPPRHRYLSTTEHDVCVTTRNRLILKLKTMRTSLSHFRPRSKKPLSVVHIALDAFKFRRELLEYSLYLIFQRWRETSRQEK